MVALAGAAATGCCGGGNDDTAVARGFFRNETQRFVNVFTGDGSTALYIRPQQQISLDFKSGFTVKVAFSPGQDVPEGIMATQSVSCCCTAAATCDNPGCGTVVAHDD